MVGYKINHSVFTGGGRIELRLSSSAWDGWADGAGVYGLYGADWRYISGQQLIF